MRRIAVTLAFCFFLSVPAFAEEPETPARPSDPPKVEVIEDQEAGVVRVFIGGKEVLTIDNQGLHINGDITYTGQITDAGTAP